MKLLKGILEFSAKFILKHPISVFVGSCCLGLISIYFTLQLKLDPSLDRLLPSGHSVFKVISEVKETFGHQDIVTIYIKSSSFKEGKAFVEKSAQELKKNPELLDVAYKLSINFFKKNSFLYADKSDLRKIYKRINTKIEYEKRKGRVGLLLDDIEEKDPGLSYNDILDKYKNRVNFEINQTNKTDFFYKKKVTQKNKENHIFVIMAKPRKAALDLSYASFIISEISETMKKNKVDFPAIQSIEFTGRYQKKPESINALIKSFKTVTIISVIGVFFLLIFFFRSIRPILLVFTGLIYGILLTLALAQIFIGTLNLISTFLIAILLGLGMDFGIHIILRYKEERDSGKSVEEAFMLMYTGTCLASIVAGLTTAVAFGMLMFSNFIGFSDFGFIGSVGIICTLFAYMSLMSSVLIVLTRYFNYRIILSPRKFYLPKKIWRNPRRIIWVCSVITIISIAASSYLKFDYNFSRLLGNKNLPSYQLDEEVNNIFGKISSVPSIILAENIEEEKEILEQIQAITDTKDQKKFISTAVGLTSFVPENQFQKLSIIRSIKSLINVNRKHINSLDQKYKQKIQRFEKLLNPRSFTIKDLPVFITKKFQSVKPDNTKRIILIYPSIQLENGLEILRFSNKLEEIKVNGKPIQVASDSMIFAEILRLIKGEGIVILILTFLAIYFMVSLSLKSVVNGLIVFLPLIIGLIWLAGVQGLLNIKSDFINIIAYPVIIGISIDAAVHFYHRYIESQNLFIAMNNTGEAISLSSATTFIAFSSLLFAQNEAVIGLGVLSIVGITVNYLSCMLILPAILTLRTAAQGRNKLKKSN